ncbi:MAG: plastocyanin/azurin family copper-binding protein [Gaiellaceae bacterium]
MSAPDVTSPVTPPAPGWAKPFPRDERLFLWLVSGSVVVMMVFVIVWLYAGHQNVPATAHATTPVAFASQVTKFAKQYGGPDGRVYVPAGTDAYMLASRYAWYPELVLESGKTYRIWLSSADVLHGFSLVDQNLNLEVAPHHAMGVKLTIGTPGRYLIVCNEFCGLGHAQMKGHLDVITPQAMQTYLAAHPQTPATATPAAPAAGALQLGVVDNKLAFDKTSLTARAGKVTIALTNPSAIPHDIAIKGNGVDVKGAVVSAGGRSTVTATLKPGTYVFYCSVPGHEAAGMHGTLTVTP